MPAPGIRFDAPNLDVIISLPGVTPDVTQQVRTMPNNVMSTSISKAYPYDANPLLAGRSYFEQGPDGSTRTYSYEAGNWTQATALFTPNAAGLAVRTSVIEGVPHGAGTGPMIGVTKKEVSVTDANGFGVFEEEWICTAEGATPTFVFLTNTVNTYDTAGHRRLFRKWSGFLNWLERG